MKIIKIKHWQDILIVLFLATVVGSTLYYLAQLIDPDIVTFKVENVWFDGDSQRTLGNMTSSRSLGNYRSSVHPLFSLIAYPFTLVVRKVLGVEPLTAVRLLYSGAAALWIGVLFATLRLISYRRLDAILFSLLGAISAAAIFWFTVPETYSFGSLSILLALGFVALTELRQFSSIWYIAVSTLTLSFTTTNWMVGILITVVNHRWKKTLQITATVFFLTTLLWFLEKKVFPHTQFFVATSEEEKYLIRPDLGHLFQVAQSFFLHTMVIPAIKLTENAKEFQDLGWPQMSIQGSAAGSGSLLGFVAIWLWIALLGLGLWGLFSIKNHLKLRLVLGLAILGQFTLHSLYGSETFLYSLHFAPLLVGVAALSTLTRVRRISLVLAGFLVLTMEINNWLQFSKAVTIIQTIGPQRHQVQAQMRLRPADPWSRGIGHVVLAAPGSLEIDKAYHEPGGSFSPAVGSFGVSLWLTDTLGNLKATSDSISLVELDLPDHQFAESLNAQVTHIQMGLVGKETRPGEPTYYPLAWQRDGAYEVVARARAGQLEMAKELATYFAEHDFFGGFGAEADAPGLSIWALEELAVHLKQPEYDQWLWSHIRRKAKFILRMMATAEPIRQPFEGSVVTVEKDNPELTLVAEPAKNGLIVGRMDWQRPLLFVNAVSYRGLLDAATLADRINQPADAKQWRDAAVKLHLAWEKALKSSELENDRTYISGIWPTWIADSHYKTKFNQALQARWSRLRDAEGGFHTVPLWTYFDIAEAHQWLLLNQPDRVWSTLHWFWNHQTSPGLYTWWEGKGGEENSLNQWERLRGWVHPPNVTPHYWIAAEMLLPQLDMLAYTDLSAKQPTVVIGTGVPKNWLSHPMSVRGLPMSFGKLDWNWDGLQMQVTISSKPVNVQLGSIFS